jgi:hypothetical protein
MPDTHENLPTIRSKLLFKSGCTYSEGNPNARAGKKNLDRDPNTRDSKHAPVKTQDGDLGKE